MQSDLEIQRVVERYTDTLLRAAFSQLKNRADAEDMVQEAFLRFMEKAPVFENTEHEKAWLLRVVINLSRNRLASAWFRRSAPLDEEIPALDPPETGVVEAVSALPPRYRAVVHLYYYEGYSVEETAKLLGRKSSTVASQLSRARARLAQELGEAF